MDYTAIKFWFDIAQTLLIALIGVQQFLYKRQSATISSIDRIDNNATKGISDLDKRITRLEEIFAHIPTHEDLGKIHEKINAINSILQELVGSNKHIKNHLDILIQHALSKDTSK